MLLCADTNIVFCPLELRENFLVPSRKGLSVSNLPGACEAVLDAAAGRPAGSAGSGRDAAGRQSQQGDQQQRHEPLHRRTGGH